MFRASLCPSSGEQGVCYCTWCAALVLLDVVGSGCWALRCRVRGPYKAAPHNRYQPHPAEPAQHTTCSNTRLVLLKMDIMMPETCWESVDNKHLTVASFGFLSHFTTRKYVGPWEQHRPCRYTISWCCTNKYWSPCGPTACSCGDARNRATLTSFSDFKTRYLGISLMHLGMSETPTSIGTLKWRWLWMKLKSSLRSIKKGFSTASTSKRSSCSTTVNWCEGFKGGGLCSDH